MEFSAFDDPHVGSINVQQRKVALCSPEVRNHLFHLVHVHLVRNNLLFLLDLD